jgi:hypothetical protein
VYELLTNVVPPELIIRTLTTELLRKLDDDVKHEVWRISCHIHCFHTGHNHVQRTAEGRSQIPVMLGALVQSRGRRLLFGYGIFFMCIIVCTSLRRTSLPGFFDRSNVILDHCDARDLPSSASQACETLLCVASSCVASGLLRVLASRARHLPSSVTGPSRLTSASMCHRW